MEVLAALGIGAKELFNYNRENFKFDQDQRIEREALRMEMQVKRFELFREDVRDLVTLTVDRMDVYHLVGALFLEFCIVLFCEGRVQASAPPFLLSLFLLSNASAFIYLLLAVWLSMHASIASHSFGVRLLTRFVRLPIPSIKQMNNLRSKLQDYEHQGVANLLRLPFLDRRGQKWKQVDTAGASDATGQLVGGAPELRRRRAGKGDAGEQQPAGSGTVAGAAGENRVAAGTTSSPPRTLRSLPSFTAPSPTGERAASVEEQGKAAGSAQQQSTTEEHLLPEEDEAPLGGDDLLTGGNGALPDRHVQLFRQLQSKWQCYDAYCRVCMGLGVNQILQGLSYFSVCHTLVENHSPTTGFALVLLFQCTTVALAILDLAGLKRREIVAIQVIGMMPCFFAAWSTARAVRSEQGVLDPSHKYYVSPLSFLFQALWLELWLRVATPSGASSGLPRRFRQVLFLDVFGDAAGWTPSSDDAAGDGGLSEADGDEEGFQELDTAAEEASSQLALVQAAVRRWKAAPDWALSRDQRRELDSFSNILGSSGATIQAELDRRRTLAGLLPEPGVFEPRLRRWSDLSAAAQRSDPFAGCLLGPFSHDEGYEASSYHYDLEGQQCLFEDTPSSACPGAHVLLLSAVRQLVKDLEVAERRLLEVRILRELRAAQRRHLSSLPEGSRGKTLDRGKEGAPPGAHLASASARLAATAQVAKDSFPNLASLLEQRRHSPLLLAPPSSGGSQSPGAGGSPKQKRPQTSPGGAAGQPAAGAPPSLLLQVPSSSASGSQEIELSTLQDSTERSVDPEGGAEASQGGGRAGEEVTDTHDPTLMAMAGQHAKHFVPERLPWHVLSRMTRVLQVCWLWSGLMILLTVADIYQVDFQRQERDPQFCASGQVRFERLNVQWPHGSMFNPRGLLCGFAGSGQLLVSSPFALYHTSLPDAHDAHLEKLAELSLPPSTVALCAPLPSAPWPPTAGSCLLAAPSQEGVAVWRVGDDRWGSSAVELTVRGAPWRTLAGALVRCDAVGQLMRSDQLPASWCLLLSGWDGEGLPVAVVPLQGGLGGLPAAGSVIAPSLDAPLDPEDVRQGVAALSLEPRSGRLFVLLAAGYLEVWDLLNAQRVGGWRLHWAPVAADFRPAAICGYDETVLLVAGRSKAAGPLLLHTRLPFPFAGFLAPNGTELVQQSS